MFRVDGQTVDSVGANANVSKDTAAVLGEEALAASKSTSLTFSSGGQQGGALLLCTLSFYLLLLLLLFFIFVFLFLFLFCGGGGATLTDCHVATELRCVALDHPLQLC